MPVAVPMKLRMSRTLAFGPKLTTGSGAVGFSSGALVRRGPSRGVVVAGAGGAALFAGLVAGGVGTGCLDAVANDFLELARPRRGETIRAIQFNRAMVFH